MLRAFLANCRPVTAPKQRPPRFSAESCTSITFHANVFGLAGVATVEGTAVAGLGPARLYDRRGDLVGSENAQFLSDPKVVSECNSPQGVTENPFSSVIELFG